jgi:orotate phosphoribosyltransferase
MAKYACFDIDKGKNVASLLLEAEAIKLSPEKPFTWASGWKSPIYCDNRVSLSFPGIRTKIKKLLVEAIAARFPSVEAIAGVATAGIPQGALVADEMGLPFIYVRSKSKSHGLTNQIEGKITSGQKVVVLEDLVSTGGSSLAAVDALKTAGLKVLGMACIFTYGFPVAEQNFNTAGIDLVYLSEYSLLLEEALSQKLINNNTISTLSSWRSDPANWG